MTLPAFAPSVTQFLCPEWSVLRFEGPQTREFLQSQLTNDVLTQTPERARLNGLCSPKGRLLASFLVVVRSDEVVDLVVSSDLAPALLKRLSMFVLRTKTKGALASPALQVAASTAPATVGTQDGGPDYAIAQKDDQLWIRLPRTQAQPLSNQSDPSGSIDRWLGLVPEAASIAMPDPVIHQHWLELEVLSAIPRITTPTQDLFVPQTINFELLEGVSFTKGCYPGQEVVARSQYLGKLRRRMGLGYLAVLSGQADLATPGVDVVDPAGQATGRVVMSAQATGGGQWVLFEAPTEAMQDSSLSVNGQAIKLAPLPYTIPEPVAPTRPKL